MLSNNTPRLLATCYKTNQQGMQQEESHRLAREKESERGKSGSRFIFFFCIWRCVQYMLHVVCTLEFRLKSSRNKTKKKVKRVVGFMIKDIASLCLYTHATRFQMFQEYFDLLAIMSSCPKECFKRTRRELK